MVCDDSISTQAGERRLERQESYFDIDVLVYLHSFTKDVYPLDYIGELPHPSDLLQERAITGTIIFSLKGAFG